MARKLHTSCQWICNCFRPSRYYLRERISFRMQLILSMSTETPQNSGVRSPESEFNVIFWMMTKVCLPCVTHCVTDTVCFILLCLPGTWSKYGSNNQSHMSAAGRECFWRGALTIQVSIMSNWGVAISCDVLKTHPFCSQQHPGASLSRGFCRTAVEASSYWLLLIINVF